MITDNIGLSGVLFPSVLPSEKEVMLLSYKKEEFASFEITSLDGQRLYYTDSNFDFPLMYDSDDNVIDNMLMIKGKRLPELSCSDYVYVVATMRGGDRYRYKTAISVSTEFQINVILRPDKAELLEERRRYFKIKTNERAFITLRTQEDDEKPNPLDPPAEICIRDINVGGVFFVCADNRRSFAKGDKLMMVLNLSGTRMELGAEVLREQKTADNEETQVGYGCRFTGVSRSQEETISRYIYKLQFEMLQKSREKRDNF